MRTGSSATRLIVLRGNSGSGKTSVARAVRQAHGYGLALVGQDVVRRELLRERDVAGGVNIGLIDTIARHCLDNGYHVLLEGILTAERYGPMLQALHRDHAGTSAFFYLDVPWPRRSGVMRPVPSGGSSVRGRCGSGTGNGTCCRTNARRSSGRTARWKARWSGSCAGPDWRVRNRTLCRVTDRQSIPTCSGRSCAGSPGHPDPGADA